MSEDASKVIDRVFSQMYALVERQRIFALSFSDKRFARALREFQKEMFVKKAEILKALQSKKK